MTISPPLIPREIPAWPRFEERAVLTVTCLGARQGWSSDLVLFSLVVAAATLGGFVWIDLRTVKPLIDIGMFKDKMLAAALAAVVLSHAIYNPTRAVRAALAAKCFGSLPPCCRTDACRLAVVDGAGVAAERPPGRSCRRSDHRYHRLGDDRGRHRVVLSARRRFFNADRHHRARCDGCRHRFFTPANQKAAFASVRQEDFGVLAAMLSSFGTAAGTIGIAVTVALMEVDGGEKLWTEPQVLAGAQQFAFSWLVPVGLLGLWIAIKGRPKRR